MYYIVLDSEDGRFYWVGGGYEQDLEVAVQYHSKESADAVAEKLRKHISPFVDEYVKVIEVK